MSSSENIEKAGVREKTHHEWHALSVSDVERVLNTKRDGLTDEEVKERKRVYGSNEFRKVKSDTVFLRIFNQLKSPLVVILVIACAITIALNEFIDAGVIALALLVAVVVGVIQEGKATRAFEKLANSQVHRAIVIRGGKKHEVLASELVPGDVTILQSGMQVPADMRLCEIKRLSVNESALTGEWLAVEKGIDGVPVGTPQAEITSMAYKGTFVAEGHGVGYVVATGGDTVVGTLAEDLSRIDSESTPLQRQMTELSRIMLIFILTLVVGIFLIGALRGEALETMLLTSIAIAVASIPEGLPAAVTIVLAIGMETLLRRGGLVRNLLAAETLGSTTYVLTDKTGTLTKAQMAVADVVYVGCESGNGKNVCNWREDVHAHNLFDIALCASDAFFDETQNEHESYVVRGEPMERAILEAAHEIGISLSGDTSRGKRVDYLSFSSENRFAAGVTTHNDECRLCVNGAPEYLLSYANRAYSGKGIVELNDQNRSFFEECIEINTKAGRRIIAVAYKEVAYDSVPEDDVEVLKDTIFMGLLIFHDPVRKGVDRAIEGVKGAGAEVRLVTGDNKETALTIAREVGIAQKEDVALSGNDIAELSDDELLEIIRTTKVFARVLPRQKMRLARVLQTSGEIVAMTGDGINDAPALQKANIGVAIGSGTEVAKEASDLVLVKDSFATIYAAIEEGRRIISNLRKIVGYLLSTSLSEAVLVGAALITGAPTPILPAQILWANMVEEGLMSVAFAFEKGDRNMMKEKPSDIHEDGVLPREMIVFLVCVVLSITTLLLLFYGVLRVMELPLEQVRSIMFLAISIDSLFIAFSFRSLTTPLWKVPLKNNLFFVFSFLLNLVLLGIVLTVPFLQFVLSYEPQPFHFIFAAFVYGFMTMMVVEIGKWIIFERRR